MFEQSLLQNTGKSGWRKTGSLVLSVSIQCLVVAAMIVSPMIFTEGAPRLGAVIRNVLVTPMPPGPEPIPRPTGHPTGSPSALHLRTDQPPAAIEVPHGIATTIYTDGPDTLPQPLGDGPGTPGGGGVTGGVGTMPITFIDPKLPERPTAPQQEKTQRIQVTTIESSRILFRPQPAYPQMARQTHTQGLVRLEAIISKTGLIENLRIISGHPLLTQAALDAVRQWRYTPTILNGQAVEVITTVDVTFTLNQ